MLEGYTFSGEITEVADLAQRLLGTVAACDLDASCRVFWMAVTGTFRTPSDNLPGSVVGHGYLQNNRIRRARIGIVRGNRQNTILASGHDKTKYRSCGIVSDLPCGFLESGTNCEHATVVKRKGRMHEGLPGGAMGGEVLQSALSFLSRVRLLPGFALSPVSVCERMERWI